MHPDPHTSALTTEVVATMAASPIYEGDTIILYSPEAKGFVYSQPPSSSFSHVTIFPVPAPQTVAHIKDPAFPSVHFASFQVLPENSNLDLENYSPLAGNLATKNSLPRALVYGRKIKLLHMASKKYLSIKSPDKAGINPVAQLVDKDDVHCLFRILNSRVGKQRGEDVNSEDSIKLECVCKKSHHLLCTLNTISTRYELKMAVTDSSFTIYSQTTSQRETFNQSMMRGSDVMMIFNVKKEAYVSGRGSIATEFLPDDIREDKVKEVGARARQASHGIQKAPPVSGDCFWQIERIDNPLSNDVFRFNDKCRLKHLPTQQYLAVEPLGHTHQLTLKQLTAGLRNDPQVTFSLISATKGITGYIQKGSYVELRHIGTGKNLTTKSSSLQHQVSDPNADVVRSSKKKWYKLVLEDSDETKKQYFRMEEVNEDLIHEYYHVSGVVAILKEYIQKFTRVDKRIPFPPPLEELKEVLRNIADWINVSTDNQKSRANMLRVAEAVDLLVGFLHEITDFSNNELFSLCRFVCGVLKRYVEGSNRKSHVYLSEKRLMDTLFSKIGNNIGVERVLSTLVRDESDLTEGIVTRLTTDPAHTARILEKLDGNTLDFLGSLCFTAGKPSRNLQNIMSNHVIKGDQSVLFKTTVVNGEVHFTYPERIAGPIKKICSTSNSSKAKDFDFFVSQLKFFSRVCKGVNFTSINIITEELEYVSFEQALICINDSELHPLLRSVYLDFVISAFVDYNVEESGTDIDNIWRSFYWDEITPNPMEAAGMGDNFDVIPNTDEIRALQTSIRNFLGECKVLYAEEKVDGHNELLTVMLSTMEPLVSYGFYWKADEIVTIVNFLINILDGTSDRPSKGASPADVTAYQTKDRYKSNEKNRGVFKVKSKAVKLLHLIFKQLSYMSLAKLTYDFKSLVNEIAASPESAYTPINEGLAVLVNDDFELNSGNSNLVNLARERLRFYFHETAYSFFDYSKGEGEVLIKILMDLMKYENDELKLSSTKLLFDIFQEEKILFNDAKKSYIVTEASENAYYEMITTGALSDDDKILLRLMQGTAISGDVNELLVTHLNYVSEACIVDKDETIPNYSTQWIAYSCGVFQALLTYVLSFSLTENEKQRELLDLACHTLCRIIVGNPQIQAKLFSSFVDLIESKTAVKSVARMLTETVTGNIALCRKLSEADIRSLYQTANSGMEYNEYYVTLEAIIRVSKSNPVLLKKHQDLVSHILSDSIPDYFSSLLLSNKAKERLEILTKFDDEDALLVQLLCMSDLLATCAEGQCKFAEYTCQGIFTLEELLSILGNPKISYQRKKPFARILHWAYLNTERDSLTALSTVCKKEEFWTHIEEVSVYIDSLCHKIQEGNIETDGLRKILRMLFSKHMSLQAWLECSEEINVPVPLKPNESVESDSEEEEDSEKDSDDDDDDDSASSKHSTAEKSPQDEVPMNSLLFYICDGVIPFISSFCTQLEIQNSSGLTSKVYASLLSPKVISVLKSIGGSVAKMLVQLPEIFATSETQVHLFSGCLESLVFVLPSDHTKMINQATESVLSLGEEFFHTPAELEFHSDFSDELSRNERFRTFVKHFETTYDGVIKSQDDLEGNEVLVKGTSFQKLVNVFSQESSLFRNEQSLKLEKVRILLRLLDILYRQLQQPLTGGERAELDSMLLTALQIMSGIVLARIDDIDQSLQSRDPEKFEMEYTAKVLPIQDRLVKMKSYEKVMNHLSHPDDEVAVHALGFLRVVLYLGNAEAQKNIGHLTVRHNTKFFIRISQLLEGVITSLGRPVLNLRVFNKQVSAMAAEAKKQLPPPPPTDQELETASKDGTSHIAGRGLEEEELSDATPLVQKAAAKGDIEMDNMVKDNKTSEGGSEEDDDEEIDTEVQANPAATADNDEDNDEEEEEEESEEESEDFDFDDDDFDFDEEEYDDYDYDYDTDEDEEEEEDYDIDYDYDDYDDETDYGENVKRIARKYNVLGAGQLETSTDDALKRASIVLDVVSWLCDGQNREMQQTLRQQGFAFSNVNIVSEIAVVLQTLAEHLSLKNMFITKKAIQALIEMCAGNYPNQETAIKGQIIDSINTMLQMNFRKPTEEEVTQVLEVRASAIELLEVMLEETHENSRFLAQGISDDLAVPTLLHVMLDITQLGEANEGLQIKANRAVFRAYHVLKRIADYLDENLDDYVESKSPKFLLKYPKAKSMWVHLGNWSRSIEVNYVTKDNKEILTRVYFPFNPSKELSEGDKDIVKDNIVRESPDDKVKDLLEWMESIRKNIRHKVFIHSKLWLLWAIILSGPRHLALMFLTLLLNVLVLFLYEVPDGLGFSDNFNSSNASVTIINEPEIPVWFSTYALFILGGLHLILGLWMTIEYFVVEAKNILVSFPLLETLIWDIKKWIYRHETLKNIAFKINQTFCGGSITVNPPEDAKCFEVYLLSFAPLYRLLFVACSILSLAFHGYFYCGCILYLFLKSAVLHQVLTAVRRSALQLIVVGLLAVAVLLIYAVISFAILHNFFDPENDNLFCETLWQCFVTVTREGLLDTLGATLPVTYVGQESPSFTVYAVRTIFDLSFFIIITTLGLNIVVAILVDRFSELRSEKDEIKKDKLNYCFVCGLDNDTFERKAKGFRHHVQNDHSKWNYIYFVLHLDSLYTNDHNALEKYVYDNIQDRKIGFFPVRKAKVLGSHSQ